MLSSREIDSEKERLQIFLTMVETFEEIAAIRMRKIRSSILNYRDFVLGITTIFQEIKSSYRYKILSLMRNKKIPELAKLTLLKRNGKTACVLLSANTGLYGDVVKKIFNKFSSYISTHTVDIIIAGRLGRALFQQAFPNRPFTYVELPDHTISVQELQKLSQFLLHYESILVFYGSFHSLSNQTAEVISIYDKEIEAPSNEKVDVHYLPEPSLEKLMVFFEREIFASILEQSIHESDLAKLASRMYTLDHATENIKGSIKKVDLQRRIAIHRLQNQKQQDTLTSISLWRQR